MSEYLGAPNTTSSRRDRILQRLQRDRLATLQARTLGIERTSEYRPGGVRHIVVRYRLATGESSHE